MTMQSLRDTAEGIEDVLRLQTFPLAVRMLRSEREIPDGAERPLRDLGYHLSSCQIFSLSRRDGMTLVQTKEDMWCYEPVIGYGWAEPTEVYLEGLNRFPKSARTLDAGRTWARAMPKLEVGACVGVVSAPAKTAAFEPDLVMIYCDPSQLTQLLIVKNWLDGLDVGSQLSGHAACVYAVVPTLQSGQWAVTCPCRGDRARGLARDDEMIVSIPSAQLPDVLDGLMHSKAEGSGLPLGLSVRPEYPLAPSYIDMGRSLGMDWVK